MRASANAAPPSSARERGDLLDVGGGVAAHARRVAAEHLRRPGRPGCSSRSGRSDAEVPRDRLEAVTRAGRASRSRAAAPRRACRSARVPAPRTARGRPLAPGAAPTPRRAGALPQARRRRGARARAARRASRARRCEERQVEAVQVVVLDHVGIGVADRARRAARSGRPPPRRLSPAASSTVVRPAGSRTAIMKIRSRVGIEPGGLEIELQAVQLVEREVAEVGATRRDEVLLLGRQHQRRRRAKVAQVTDTPPRPTRRGREHGRRQRLARISAHQVAQRPGPVEFAARHAGSRSARWTTNPARQRRSRPAATAGTDPLRGRARRCREDGARRTPAHRARPTPRRCPVSDPIPTAIRLSSSSRAHRRARRRSATDAVVHLLPGWINAPRGSGVRATRPAPRPRVRAGVRRAAPPAAPVADDGSTPASPAPCRPAS